MIHIFDNSSKYRKIGRMLIFLFHRINGWDTLFIESRLGLVISAINTRNETMHILLNSQNNWNFCQLSLIFKGILWKSTLRIESIPHILIPSNSFPRFPWKRVADERAHGREGPVHLGHRVGRERGRRGAKVERSLRSTIGIESNPPPRLHSES